MYVKVYVTDIWEEKKSKKQYNPVQVQTEVNGDYHVTLKDIETSEEITIRLIDFKYNYKRIKLGNMGSKFFMI